MAEAQDLKREGAGSDIVYRIVRPDGAIRWIHDRSYAIHDAEGGVERVVGIARDITKQKAAEDALRDSEARFRMLVESVPAIAIQGYQEDGTVFLWNAASERLYGYTAEEAIGRNLIDLIIPDAMKEQMREDIRNAHESGADLQSSDLELKRKDGTPVLVHSSHALVRRPGRPAELFCIDVDISERRAFEQKLQQQAELLDQASDAILVRDLDNRIVYWNRGAGQIYGWDADEVLGRNAGELLYADPEQLAAATAALLASGEWSGELEQKTKSGETVTVLGRWTLLKRPDGSPDAILAINTDISDKKRLEVQFMRAQRMESIGTLAGGIAHDLNNILAPILMSVEMLHPEVASEEGRATLETVRASAQRGADLIKQILGFARGIEGDRVAIDPLQVIGEIERVMRDTFPRNIALRIVAPDDRWPVQADPTQLHQVLINLCVNARDAMPEGGRLTIALENILIDEMFSGMNIEASPGRYVIIRVEDTGHGMPQAIQDKIFEPFFTTKELGKGTGLGLATTFSIVRDHGGFIHLYSELGKGSRFKIYLPAAAQFEPAGDVPPISEAYLPRGGGELVLIVDDEESIREITRKALERFGYRVMLACNGAEAVSIYVQHKDSIDVILTDMSMPVMDGPAMIVAIKSLDPDALIIGSSGLASNGNVAKAVGAGVEHFVPKPYTAERLLVTLRQALESRRVRPAPQAMPGAAEAGRAAESAGAEAEAGETDGATVLIVDDEASLRALTRRILERAGYAVLTAASGSEALAALDEAGGRVALLLTDYHMPGMDGVELAVAAAERQPGLKIILVSGDGQVEEERLGLLSRRDVARLRKPFTMDELRMAVSHLLAG